MLTRRTKLVIGAVGTLAAIATAWTWYVQPPRPAAPTALGFFALWGLVLLAERINVPLSWRGQRITASLTEPVVLAGFFWLPGPPLIFAAALGRLTSAAIERRPAPKTFFNAAQVALATSAAFLVFHFLPVSPIVAAMVGTATFTLVVDSATVLVVVSQERVAWRDAVRERFLAVAFLEVVFGISVGLAVVGLGRIHPLAPLLLLPVAWVLVHYGRLQAKVERENGLHQRLAKEQRQLIGIKDDHLIAQAILEACHDLMPIGRASLTVLPDQSWSKNWDNVLPGGPPDLAATLSGINGGVVGRLEVWRRPGKPRFAPEEEGLLQQLAAQTETALANARTLREASQQREVLARQERLSTLGSLIAGVAHEVNNPLTYLRGNLELALLDMEELRQATPTPEARAQSVEMERQLTVALQGANRIGEIVKSLRAVARQRPSTEREVVQLNKLVEDIATVVTAGLPDNVQLIVLPDAKAPSILAHPTDLHQVLLNLAKNGLEAIGEKGGELTLRVRDEGEWCYLEVKDTGPGIPPEVQDKLFTPFFTTKGAAGTGLGLAIVHGIMKDLGGSIRFDTSPMGTTFIVQLPHNK